jgi:branched-chain amino acid transport system ATP-binding protein
VNMSTTILTVDELVAGYGRRQILNGINLVVNEGEIVAVIGHNGAGKSTLLKSIFGLLIPDSGAVALSGITKNWPTPRDLLCGGIAYVPQGNRVFGDLTVQENLTLGGTTLSDKNELRHGLEQTFELFPVLRGKLSQRASSLSGGEKQMLAFASALILHPRLLLLDEPSLGLGPKLVREAFATIKKLCTARQIAIVIVEQKVREVLGIADRVYVLRNGKISYSGKAHDLMDDAMLRKVFL